MTTKLLIVNDPDSNNGQHVLVTIGTDPQSPVVEKRLAPGEAWSQWISTGHKIEVREIFSPKPKE